MKKINFKLRRLAFRSMLMSGILLSVLIISYKADGYSIDGDIDAPNGTIIRIAYDYKGRKTVDSTTINNNKMMLKGNLKEAVICTLSNSINQQQKIIVLQNENIKLKGSVSKFYYAEVTGAVEDKLFNSFKEENLSISGDYRKKLKESGADFHDKTSGAYLEFHRRVDSLTLAFVKTNPDAVASSLAIINSHMNSTGVLKAEFCYKYLSEKGKNNQYAKRLKAFIDASKTIEIGRQAPNFTLKDINNSSFTLDEHKGKYILLDFWASWCVPCREEHPLLKKLYTKYKESNIVFVSVSVDSSEKNWRKAVADDGLQWTQLNDPLAAKGPITASYSLLALPFNCVLDPQGKIIATKLRGAALSDFLSTLIKAK